MASKIRVRTAANDPYWNRGVGLAIGTVCGLILGGIGTLLLLSGIVS